MKFIGDDAHDVGKFAIGGLRGDRQNSSGGEGKKSEFHR